MSDFGEPEGVSPRTYPCCEMSGANAARLAGDALLVAEWAGRFLRWNLAVEPGGFSAISRWSPQAHHRVAKKNMFAIPEG